jgi:transposase
MQNYCGVDVSKDWLDCFIPPAHFERFENSPEGIGKLAGFVQAQEPCLVVMEASGGLERVPFYLLWEQQVPCAIVNARSVRDFAKAMGHLEKTDRIDASVIARYAATKAIQPTPPPSQNQQHLSALSARMRQVVSDLTVQKQRLHTANHDVAREGLLEIIAVLKRQSKSLSAEIAALIKADPLWAALDATLRSVKGVADRTVATLMADLPELGVLSNKAIAKLAGLAPLADDSGKRKACAALGAGALPSEPSSFWWPTSPANTIKASQSSVNASSTRERKKWSSASPSPTNYSSDSTPKPVKPGSHLKTPLDRSDSRSLPLVGRVGVGVW